MAQSGSASALGAEGRGFKSLCPDQPGNRKQMAPASCRQGGAVGVMILLLSVSCRLFSVLRP